MTVTERLRNAIQDSDLTHYRIWKDSGVDSRALDRFVAGETDIKGATIDALCDYLGLELTEKAGTAPKESGNKPGTPPKQAAKKPATKRKRAKKNAD
jgi:hypothetical protein